MADQATHISGNGRSGLPASAMRKSMGDMAHDIATLGELQAKLLAMDLKQTLARMIGPLIAVAVSLSLLLAAVVVALYAAAEALDRYTQLLPYAAQLIVAGGALLLAGLIVLVAWLRIRKSLALVQNRSLQELRRNLTAVKQSLREH